MKKFLLKDFLDHRNRPVFGHQFIQVDVSIRVYYKPNDYAPGHGFEFWALNNIGGHCVPGMGPDEWDKDNTFVECMFTGSAAFDGIGHLYMGDPQTDNFGYHYYPNIEAHIATLRVIGELEKTYCREKQEQLNAKNP